ncbi:YfcC family protein [Mycoplasma sp. ATU-Cv-508]|uniref:YfcC family protein n=1 Tax=Mycoplasma sp. ATU-Cv-508 TaxID=2048001 RepID=UPI000FDD9EA4
MPTKKTRKRYIPSAFTIIFAMMIVFVLASWIGSPLSSEIQGVGILDIFTAAWHGFASKAEIILFIFAIGGTLGVMTRLKAIDGGIQALVNALRGKDKILIVVLMLIFGLGGTTYGMWEETIAFFPVLIPIFVKLGYGPFMAVLVVLVGAGTGCLASTINPFAVSTAIDAIVKVNVEGETPFSDFAQGVGQGTRWLAWVIYEVAAIALVIYLGRLLKRKNGHLVGLNTEAIAHKFASSEKIVFTVRRKIALGLFMTGFVIMILGFLPWQSFFPSLKSDQGWWNTWMWWLASVDSNSAWEPLGGWYFVSVAGIFLIISVVIFAISWNDFVENDQTKEETFLTTYVSGVKDVVNVCLLIGVAAGLGIILEKTNFGPIIARSISGLAGANLILWGVSVFLISLILSFLVPSTSGFSSAFMGIFATAIALGTEQGLQNAALALTILAFIFASGVINLCAPTSAALMGYTAYSGVPYPVWIRNIWPVVLTYAVLALVLIITFGAMANQGVIF